MVVSVTKNLSLKWQNLVNQYTTKAVRWLVRHLLYSILGRFFPIAPAQIPKNRFTSLSGAILYPTVQSDEVVWLKSIFCSNLHQLWSNAASKQIELMSSTWDHFKEQTHLFKMSPS